MTDLEQTCTACEGSGRAAAPAWSARSTMKTTPTTYQPGARVLVRGHSGAFIYLRSSAAASGAVSLHVRHEAEGWCGAYRPEMVRPVPRRRRKPARLWEEL